MKEQKYPNIAFSPAVYPKYCSIRNYDDGSGVKKYCIMQDIRTKNESLAVSVIAISEDRESLLGYLYDNGLEYHDYHEEE